MKFRAAMLAGLVGLSAGPAMAQSGWSNDRDYPDYYEGLSTRTITRIVRSKGLKPVEAPRRRDGLYSVNAVDDHGQMRRVMIDARSGRVVGIHAAGRPVARGPVVDRPGPGYEDEGPELSMRPPRGLSRGSNGAGAAPEPWDDGITNAVPGDRRPPAGARPQASLPDEPDIIRGAPPRREPLPPLRPRPSEATAPLENAAPRGSERLPAPAPKMQRNTVKPATAPRTAKANPSTPPIPRPRPAAAGEPPAAAVTPTPAAAPRVVLPGGPTPKSERTAEKAPEKVPETVEAVPSVIPATPEASAQPDPAIPPAQTFE